jgi:DNA-binding CsgD family transcriptional regulator
MTPRHPAISGRQEEVLMLLAEGLELRGAARRMGITYNTARGHVAIARERLGALTTTQAVVMMSHLRDREDVAP